MIHDLQSGLRKKYSTETALIRLVDQLFLKLDKNRVSGLIFIDYKKAFDLIHAYGIVSNELGLIEDYLSHRTQFVELSGQRSMSSSITMGVPQGSVLGPLLFLLFINDLPGSVQKCVLNIYADDTTMSTSTDLKDAPQSLCTNLQADLNEVASWTSDNKMVLNESKTKVMLVTGKRLATKLDDKTMVIKIDDTNLEQVHSFSLLGLTIDSNLNFNDHVDNLCTKLSKRIGILRKIRSFLPIKERKLFYESTIKALMMYASSVWTTCSTENLNKVLKLQKRAARVILKADRYENSVNLFKKLGWLTFYDESKVVKSSLVYKRLHGDTADYLVNILPRNTDIHNRNTRNGQINLYCPRYKYESDGGNSFSVSVTRLWNSIPTNIRRLPTLNSFKKSYRKLLLARYDSITQFSVFKS